MKDELQVRQDFEPTVACYFAREIGVMAIIYPELSDDRSVGFFRDATEIDVNLHQIVYGMMC